MSDEYKDVGKLSPFDYVNNINEKSDPLETKSYSPYIVNKAFSNFRDTIGAANLANQMFWLDKDMQYAFLYHLISKKKRWSKWPKKRKIEGDLIEFVKIKYGYSNKRAEEALEILNDREIEEIRKSFEKGGLKGNK